MPDTSSANFSTLRTAVPAVDKIIPAGQRETTRAAPPLPAPRAA